MLDMLTVLASQFSSESPCACNASHSAPAPLISFGFKGHGEQ